jgi:hypothetical protein
MDQAKTNPQKIWIEGTGSMGRRINQICAEHEYMISLTDPVE